MKAEHLHIAREAIAHALDGFSTGFEIVNLGVDSPMFCVVIPEGDTEGAKDIVLDLLNTKAPAFHRWSHGWGKTLVIEGCSLPPGGIVIAGTLNGWD